MSGIVLVIGRFLPRAGGQATKLAVGAMVKGAGSRREAGAESPLSDAEKLRGPAGRDCLVLDNCPKHLNVGPMEHARSRHVLAHRGWLAATPADFRAALLDACRWRGLGAGESLYVAGDSPGGIFGIASGALLLSSGLAAPGTPPNRVAAVGEWSGFGPLMSQEPRRGSVVAAVPSIVGVVPLSSASAMLGEHPAWWRHFGHGLLLEFDIVSSIAVDLQTAGSAQRCAALLLHCAGCRHADPPDGTHATVWTSQESFAALVNVSRSTLSKTLARFVQQGLIDVEYRSIRLLDAPRLRRMADIPRGGDA